MDNTNEEIKYKTELKKFGDLVPGDQIIGANGKPVTVTAAYEKHIPKVMYEIEMEDGEVVQASGNHMWYCETELDEKNKFHYEELAGEYFRSHEIPNKLDEDELFPIQDIIKIFGDKMNVILFIEKACKSLGYSSYTPHLMYDDKFKIAGHKEAIFNYSYNDLIDFLHQMKSSTINNEGYFYFGEVRTTDEIFELINKGMDVNIPHKSDIIENEGYTSNSDKM